MDTKSFSILFTQTRRREEKIKYFVVEDIAVVEAKDAVFRN